MRRRQNCLCGRKNICSKQPEDIRANFTEEPQFSRCRISRIIKDA